MNVFPVSPLLALEVHDLPTVNALLNATATALLVAGFLLIKRGREQAHKWAMLAAFGVSIVFLACYAVYHVKVGSVPFQGPQAVRYIYLAILLPHIILAAAVPVLAIATIYLGLRDRRAAHRKAARWTLPIWLYVSVTGVIIYLMLYHLYPAPPRQTIIPHAPAPAEAAWEVG